MPPEIDTLPEELGAPAGAAPLDPAEERVEVTLPDEFQAIPEEAAAAGPTGAPEADLEAAPAAPPRGRGMVPKSALLRERDRRQAAQALYEEAETGRRQWEAEVQTLRRREAEAASRAAQVEPNYDELPSLREAFQAHGQQLRREIHQAREDFQAELTATKILTSQDLMRDAVEDYDEVLERSGVQAAVALDPTTGRRKDEFLFSMIANNANPARAAYLYGLGRLAKGRESAAELRGEARGRAEVVHQVVAAAERPRGIRAFSNSSAGKTGMSRRDIDAMSDARKGWLKQHRPDLYEWWLNE